MSLQSNSFLTAWPKCGPTQRWQMVKSGQQTPQDNQTQNDRYFPDDIFKYIFLNENVCIPIKIWLTFVPKGPINNIPTFVQIMAWRRLGNQPLSEPMVVRLPTYKCVTWTQWVLNSTEGNPPWGCWPVQNRPTDCGGMQQFHVKHRKYTYSYNQDGFSDSDLLKQDAQRTTTPLAGRDQTCEH